MSHAVSGYVSPEHRTRTCQHMIERKVATEANLRHCDSLMDCIMQNGEGGVMNCKHSALVIEGWRGHCVHL